MAIKSRVRAARTYRESWARANYRLDPETGLVESNQRWSAAGPEALSWLSGIALEGNSISGFDVGPMPDRVFVLHPLAERVDGAPVEAGYEWQGGPSDPVWVDTDSPEPETRSLRWDEYAKRKQIVALSPSRWPTYASALPGVYDDEYVYPPDDGTLDDVRTRDALLAILIRHTARGGAQMGTAFYNEFWLLGHPEHGIPTRAHILRGPLGASDELFDRPGYLQSPHNLWPDDHTWVLHTDDDAWCTAISGTTDLIEDILACADLEAVRLPGIR